MAPFQYDFAAPIVIGFVLVGQSLVAYLGVIAIVLKSMHNGLPVDQNVKKKNDRYALFRPAPGNL